MPISAGDKYSIDGSLNRLDKCGGEVEVESSLDNVGAREGGEDAELFETVGAHIFFDVFNESESKNSNGRCGLKSNTTISKQDSDEQHEEKKDRSSRTASTSSSDLELVQRRPPAIDLDRMEEVQMLSDFLEMHFPSVEAKADLNSRMSYLAGLPDIDLSANPMLRDAVKAICYAHAGSNYKDNRLVQRSQWSYGRVLKALVNTLHKTGHESDPAIIMPCIMLLCLYDDSIPAENNNHVSGWRAHYWGVHDFLRAYGASRFNMSSPFDRLIFMNLRSPTIFLGIARRRSIIWSDPQWMDVSERVGFSNPSLGKLNRQMMLLPALMERSDKLIRQRNPDQHIGKEVIDDLMNLRARLLYWSVNESSFSDKDRKNHDIVNQENTEAFDMTIEEHVILTTNDTFTKFFDFMSKRISYDMTLYWMFCIVIDCTILRIVHFQPFTKAFVKAPKAEEVLRDAHVRAWYLCRTVYYLSKSNSQGIASFLETCIALAENFFGEVESARELGYCQAIRCATRLRVQRLRSIQPRTLCRMPDMVDEIAAASKFRSLPPKSS